MSLDGTRNILCAPTAWQPPAAGRLRKVACLCAIVCGLFTLSFFSVTSAFGGEPDGRRITSIFYLTMARLNARALACQYYVSVGRPPMNRKLMQYWDANKDVPVSRSILYITVKEIRAKLKNLTLAEKRSVCKAELQYSIVSYSMMQGLFLGSRFDKGDPPPSIDFEPVGLP